VPAGPTEDELLTAAGSARHGLVLVRGQEADLCLAVVDTNDDGALLETVLLHRGADGTWSDAGSSGAALLGQGWSGGVAYAYGHAPDAGGVEIGFRGDVRPVPVNEHGWWLVLVAAEEGEGFDLSRAPNFRPIRWPTDDDAPPRIAG
jgi:hypothetical protein